MTKAIILSAGRGERLRPLTDDCPKALVYVRDKPLIVYHIEKLAHAGITDIVINLAYLGEKIKQLLGDGSAYGVTITYSEEHAEGLETGGGLVKALPLLGSEPFISINCDVYSDYDYAKLPIKLSALAHLVLVNNPDHHPQGDFVLQDNFVQAINDTSVTRYTYSGIAVYHPDLFKGCQVERFRIPSLLNKKMTEQQVTGEYYDGQWYDIGTPERLQLAQQIDLAGQAL